MEEEAVAFRVPLREGGIPIERTGHHRRGRAIAVHDVELGDLVPLVAVVVAQISDAFPVGRDRRALAGAEP